MPNWTQEEFDAHMAKLSAQGQAGGYSSGMRIEVLPMPAPPRVNHRARGAVRKPGEMNKTEARYAAYLELQVKAGAILSFRFQMQTFKLAKDLRYTPDFQVMTLDQILEFHDTKGPKNVKRKDGSVEKVAYSQEDAKIKAKVAAEVFPEYHWCFVFPLPNGEWGRKDF